MVREVQPPSFSSIQELKDSTTSNADILQNGRVKVAGKEYRVQVNTNYEFMVSREDGEKKNFFTAASELFSHRIAEGSLESRSTRIAQVLNEKRPPAERAGFLTPPSRAPRKEVLMGRNVASSSGTKEPAGKLAKDSLLSVAKEAQKMYSKAPICELKDFRSPLTIRGSEQSPESCT